MKSLRLWLLIWGVFLVKPELFAQYTLTYLTNGSAIVVGGYTGTPVNVVVPSFVTGIGSEAFNNCSSLVSIVMGTNVTVFDDYAFNNCPNLTTITIPSTLASMGQTVFGSCTSLTSVALPANLTTIGQEPFFNCTNLTNIEVSPTNPAYSSVNGVLFNESLTSLLQYPVGRNGGYVIPTGVTNVAIGSFLGCNLTSVGIPNGVRMIGEVAFEVCPLTNLIIPPSVTNIGEAAFQYCSNLEPVLNFLKI